MNDLDREIIEKLIEIDRFRVNVKTGDNSEILLMIGSVALVIFFLPDLLPIGLLVLGLCLIMVGTVGFYSAKKIAPKHLATVESHYEELLARKKSMQPEAGD